MRLSSRMTWLLSNSPRTDTGWLLGSASCNTWGKDRAADWLSWACCCSHCVLLSARSNCQNPNQRHTATTNVVARAAAIDGRERDGDMASVLGLAGCFCHRIKIMRRQSNGLGTLVSAMSVCYRVA